jgi:hypothetical protein
LSAAHSQHGGADLLAACVVDRGEAVPCDPEQVDELREIVPGEREQRVVRAGVA